MAYLSGGRIARATDETAKDGSKVYEGICFTLLLLGFYLLFSYRKARHPLVRVRSREVEDKDEIDDLRSRL